MALKTTHFERAIFLNWYCALDCKFCYMATQKNKIDDPMMSRRSFESIFAEAIICKKMGWPIEFLSSGYRTIKFDDLLFITKTVYEITGQKQWINAGVFGKAEIEKLKPYLEGMCGAVESVNKKVHDFACPNKPVEPILGMYKACDELNLKKAMTIIIGLGETFDDFPSLKKFIEENKIDNITFYSLVPHEDTAFAGAEGPRLEYYLQWIKATRQSFPKLHIVGGIWANRSSYVKPLLDAGVDSISKFPAIKLFNSKHAREIEQQSKEAGRVFTGTLTQFKEFDADSELAKLDLTDELKSKIKLKLVSYIAQLRKRDKIQVLS